MARPGMCMQMNRGVMLQRRGSSDRDWTMDADGNLTVIVAAIDQGLDNGSCQSIASNLIQTEVNNTCIIKPLPGLPSLAVWQPQIPVHSLSSFFHAIRMIDKVVDVVGGISS